MYPFLFKVTSPAGDDKFIVMIGLAVDYVHYDSAWMVDEGLPVDRTMVPDVDIAEDDKHEFDSELEALAFIKDWWGRQPNQGVEDLKSDLEVLAGDIREHRQDIDETLEALKEEREKFTEDNEGVMRRLVKKLQRLGEYPEETQEGNPNDVWAMVSGWGAYWHRWRGDTLNCPHCDADLRDLETGPPGMRHIGIIKSDRCVAVRCPDCNGTWPR